MTVSESTSSDLVSAAWAGELELLEPSTRRSPGRLGDLLSDDFVEFGQSGRAFAKADIIRALVDDPEGDTPSSAVVVDERHWRLLGSDAVLLTYLLDFGGRRSRRSSVWIREAGATRCVFHQGTSVPAD